MRCARHHDQDFDDADYAGSVSSTPNGADRADSGPPDAGDATSLEVGDLEEEPTATPRRPDRRRQLLIALGAVVAVLVGVLIALQLIRGGEGDPYIVETTTVTAGEPTPGDPIELDTGTALAAAMPGTVLGYAVSEQSESTAMLDLHALTGLLLTYSGSSDAVVLQVGQWPDGAEATDALTALRDVDGEIVGEDADVVVDGDTVGDVQTLLLPDGTERTTWRNGTVVLVAEGPEGTTRAFYDAFPL